MENQKNKSGFGGKRFVIWTSALIIGAPIGILGIILPIYTIIDMIETAVNVWSDSCICAIVDKELTAEDVAA